MSVKFKPVEALYSIALVSANNPFICESGKVPRLLSTIFQLPVPSTFFTITKDGIKQVIAQELVSEYKDRE